jgi:predicted metal-dependent hydrolase
MKLPENYTLLFKNVKYVGIRVSHDQRVRIVVPQGIREEHLELILRGRESWIQKQLHKYRTKTQPLPLKENQLLYKGKIFTLEQQENLRRVVEIDEDQRLIRSGDHLFNKNRQMVWYRIEAKKYLEQRVHALASQYGFHYDRIFIRSQKTRWGSCSQRKNISLNWRLIKAPLSMIDYVILHELVHTECMNHSKEYWKRLQLLCPEYRISIQWFKDHGREL